jgi:DNA repair protein RecO (recombination protein O)
MVHSTKGIVLRAVSYGETSMIVSLYTELFGLQSYIVNGVRTSKKTAVKNNLFQPACILEMEVYHNELKNLQRIREARWHYPYRDIFFSIPKNMVALFMTELLQKMIRQPEHNPDLFNFIEDAFIQLDEADAKVTAAYPLFFALQLTTFFGFGIRDGYSPSGRMLDLREGAFVKHLPEHPFYLDEPASIAISKLLKVIQPAELRDIALPLAIRRKVLESILQFYALHVQDFGVMKSLPVLQEILS